MCVGYCISVFNIAKKLLTLESRALFLPPASQHKLSEWIVCFSAFMLYATWKKGDFLENWHVLSWFVQSKSVLYNLLRVLEQNAISKQTCIYIYIVTGILQSNGEQHKQVKCSTGLHSAISAAGDWEKSGRGGKNKEREQRMLCEIVMENRKPTTFSRIKAGVNCFIAARFFFFFFWYSFQFSLLS